MKFKFNGDLYQVHPVAVRIMQLMLSFIALYIICIAGSFGVISLIAALISLFIIAVVFRDGNIQ